VLYRDLERYDVDIGLAELRRNGGNAQPFDADGHRGRPDLAVAIAASVSRSIGVPLRAAVNGCGGLQPAREGFLGRLPPYTPRRGTRLKSVP
jgi:hypothetical protein